MKRRQSGVALLVAIVMFAIATTVAAAITYSKAMAARRAAATFTLEQALQAGMAAEALAGIVLEEDAGNARTDPSKDWAQPLGPVEIEGTGVWIEAQLDDLTGRFNLNNLVQWDPGSGLFVADPLQVQVFKTLLRDLDIDQRYADLMTDWIDSGIDPGNDGGEDTLYLTQVPPYRPPNTFVTHTSEILAMPKFGAANYAKLAPYITALPNGTQVNAYTASGFLLDAERNDGQSEYAGQNLAEQRKQGLFPPLAGYFSGIGDAKLQGEAKQRVGEHSSWFRLRTHIRVGTAEFVLYSVLFREPGKKVRTVQRSFGSE